MKTWGDIERQIKASERETCWMWTGTKNPKGYGVSWFDGKVWVIQRLMWTRVYGPIPKGLLIRHKCDNPPCCNPNHLVIGTHTDNMQDCKDRGRHPQWQKAHCHAGHRLSGSNLKLHKRTDGRCVERICLACSSARNKKQKDKLKAARHAANPQLADRAYRKKSEDDFAAAGSGLGLR